MLHSRLLLSCRRATTRVVRPALLVVALVVVLVVATAVSARDAAPSIAAPLAGTSAGAAVRRAAVAPPVMARTPPAGPRNGRWRPPLEAIEVAHPFRAPPHPYAAGHRGVDLHARPGTAVMAAAGGVVTFAGPVAGRAVLVVDHGRLRTTYEPVQPGVRRGQRVVAGQPVGHLDLVGSHCAPLACLHWGARVDDRYVDPLLLLGAGPVRLLPW